MRNPLRTTVGQFSNAGGHPQPRAANVRAVEPAAGLPGAEHGNFYVLLEVTGSGGGHAALYRQMLNAAQTAFYETEGSVSAALVRAVRSVHAALRRANEALPEANWRAGITCSALEGQDLLVAQAGPALVLVGHPKTIDQFPATPEEYTAPIGGDERPEVQLIRTGIEPGSCVLIAQSEWLKYVSAEALAAATTAEDVTRVTDYLGQLAGNIELSALVIAFSAGPEGAESPSAGGAGKAPASGLRSEPAADTKAQPRASSAGAARTVSTPEPAGSGVGAKARDGGRGAVAAPAGPAKSAADWMPAGAPAYEDEEPEALDRDLVGEFEVEERPRRKLWPLVLALVVIPLLIAAVVLGMWYLRNQSSEKQFLGMLTGATAAVSEAQSLPDEAQARVRLDSARDFLDKARALKPNDARLADVETKYNQQADRINHVTPIYGTTPLWDFKTPGAKLDRVLVNSSSLFVLDRGNNQVLHFTLSELGDTVTPAQPSVIISKTQHIKDQVVGDMVDLTWGEAVGNQHSRLLVLDASGGLLGFDTTWGVDTVPVAGREQWGYAQLVTSYNGNLYIADTKANQIWRYRPGTNGYDSAPEAYFAKGSEVDLAGLASLAIDGNVWLLYADGRLLKFFAGEQKPFELTGMPQPLSGPTAIVASREGDQIYIADSGNGRIVEFSKDGKFLRQFRPADGTSFQGMRSLFLDEAISVFYVLVGDKLYKVDLPRPAAAILEHS